MNIPLLSLIVAITMASAIYGASDHSLTDKWERYKNDYGLTFDEREDAYRLGVFAKSLTHINNHNAQGHLSRLGTTRFAHLTHDEFKKRVRQTHHQHLRAHAHLTQHPHVAGAPGAPETAPTAWDWRQQGVIGPIEDQGDCGACWAFVGTEMVRSCNWIKNNRVPVLSAGQLNQCSKPEGNLGCDGGLPAWALTYVQRNGLVSQTTYPYNHGSQAACQTTITTPSAAQITGYTKLPANDPNAIRQAVAINPVGVVIQGSSQTFQHYTGGIMTGGCTTDWDHAVTIVGYGTLGTTPYWIAKNSWGTDWGEGGYLRIKRDTTNGPGLCGINIQAVYPHC